MNAKKEVLRGELIGKHAVITTKNNQCFKGKIIDETKNTITIKTKDGNKMIIKTQSTIKIEEGVINGAKIAKRPEDRLKIRG
ncbi:ribonuclease P protein subunit [Candidatus Woesearchaeota archaeon]|nr:ribonuclease P protein subunit [Candidatus Woesearchaeota archaeon]